MRISICIPTLNPAWHPARRRPKAAMLAAFGDAVRGGEPHRRLGAGVALRVAELIARATRLYNSLRLQWLKGALLTRPADDAEPEYALAEILRLRGSMSAESFAGRVRCVQEHAGRRRPPIDSRRQRRTAALRG